MSKQIQVSDTIYKRLKMAADSNYRTIGGQLEYLMDYYGSGQTPTGEKIVPKVDVSDLIDNMVPDELTPDAGKIISEATPRVDTEMACCLSATPCKHWSWSELREGYVNSLSGRFKEAS